MKKFGILLIVLIGFTTFSYAQTSATTNASATIVGTLALTKTTDLQFGNLSSPVGASTVRIAADPSSTTTPAGGIALLGGVARTAATYHVTGTATATKTNPLAI